MSLLKSCALAAAAVLVAGSAYAAPAQATTKPSTTKSAAAKTATPKAKSHSVVGTLDKYDAGANSIVVNTGKGTETLSLASTSTVHMGAKTMSTSDLSAHSGDRVKVRYSEANGQRTVESVQIEGKPAATSKPASKK